MESPGRARARKQSYEALLRGATPNQLSKLDDLLLVDRHLYLIPATGRIRIGDLEAAARDGVAITDVETLEITALEDSEIVLVDVA